MTPDLAQYLPVGEERTLLLGLAALFLLVNLLTWFAFAIDKSRAEAGGYRIPEKTLLLLALLGGWPAAKLAQLRFRHKTHKRPLGLVLNLIMVAQVVALAVLFVPMDMVKSQITSLKDQAIAQVQPEAEGEAPEKALPRRFGPGSEKADNKSGGKIGSIGG